MEIKSSLKYQAGSKPSQLVAFCSREDNNISVVDIETMETYANFQGAFLRNSSSISRSQVIEIPGTRLLCSLKHDGKNRALLKIFHISSGKINEVFSTGVIRETYSNSFIAYNSQRNLLGTIPAAGKFAYHLITLEPAVAFSKGSMKLTRKSKWPSQLPPFFRPITDLDFDKEGKRVAMINDHGMILISDVNTNAEINHLKPSNDVSGPYNKCRWISNVSESLLFVTYGDRSTCLNVCDVEKNAFELETPMKLGESSTYWIDVCPANNNLLATTGSDKQVKIYDRREAEIVKRIDPCHSGYVMSVRWNPTGEQLITAALDSCASVVDYSTGKVICTMKTNDEDETTSACFI